MSDVTPRLDIALMSTSSESKETLFNEAVFLLDVMSQPFAVSYTTTAPPVSPSNGDLYIVPFGATDAWEDEDEKLAVYVNGWRFIPPRLGFLIFVEDENEYYTYDGSSGGWNPYSLSITTLSDVPDVNNLGISDLDILIWDAGNSEWRPATLQGASVSEESDGTYTVTTGGALSVYDQGELVDDNCTELNFSGQLVTAVEGVNPNRVRINVAGPQIEDDGSVIETEVRSINFVGSGVSVSGSSDGTVDVSISGGSGGSSNLSLTMITETGTSRILSGSDFDTTKFILFTNALGCTVYVPDDLDADEPCLMVQGPSAGQVVVVPDGSGVTINAADNRDRTRVANSQMVLTPNPNPGTDTYFLGGDITTP